MAIKLTSKKQLEFDVLYTFLIGKEIEITDSKIKNQIGIKGVLIYETASMLILDVQGSEKKILKNNVFIKFDFKGKALNMDARLLFLTITNRIKKIK